MGQVAGYPSYGQADTHQPMCQGHPTKALVMSDSEAGLLVALRQSMRHEMAPWVSTYYCHYQISAAAFND